MTEQIHEVAQKRAIPAHEVLFALNLASALSYGMLIYVSKNSASFTPVNDSTYLFLRGAYRIIDLLGVRTVKSVTTGALARQFPSRWEQFAAELVVISTVLCTGALLLLLLRLLSRTSIDRAFMLKGSFISALFAAPVCYAFVSKITWNWQSEPMSPRPFPFWQNIPFLVLAAEALLLLFFSRKGTSPKMVKISFLILHFAFWTAVLWPTAGIWIYSAYTQYVLLGVFPLSALFCMRHSEPLAEYQSDSPKSRAGKWTWIAAGASCVVFWATWGPMPERNLSHIRDLDAATVELSRGPCYGSCPVYTITIQGSGEVDYAGWRLSGPQDKKSGTIRREQVAEILQILDRAHFMSLEDRAFTWAFDTSSVGVRVFVDGHAKTVVSDAYFFGAPTGRQARFVEAAQEIDKIVGSKRWTNCGGRPCVD